MYNDININLESYVFIRNTQRRNEEITIIIKILKLKNDNSSTVFANDDSHSCRLLCHASSQRQQEESI